MRGGDGDKPKETGVPAPPTTTLPDPTRASTKMKEVLGTKGAGPAARAVPLALRGRVIARDKPAAALLEVEGKLYTVIKGSAVPGPSNTVLRIIELDSNEVRIEVSPSKEIMTLR